MAAKNVADLIDAIYVQERNEDTDAQCEAAKAAWDALTDAQKALVEGEEASPDYFGLDTGDASKDDPRNQDEIGEKELLVLMSKGYSSNDIAELRGVKVETVRSTLKGVFKKTDCHSQNELLLLLQSIS